MSFAPLEIPGVTVTPEVHGDTLRVVMKGTVEARDPGATFDPYWAGLDDAVRQQGLRQVELDISGLDFMNSSGILTLVRWLMKVKAQPAYQIVLRHDQNLTWQKTNVPVLAKLAPAVVRLATV